MDGTKARRDGVGAWQQRAYLYTLYTLGSVLPERLSPRVTVHIQPRVRPWILGHHPQITLPQPLRRDEIKKAKLEIKKAIIDAKRAKMRGITVKKLYAEQGGEGGEGGGEGGGAMC